MSSNKELFDVIHRAISCTPNNNPEATSDSHERVRNAIESLQKIEEDAALEGLDDQAVSSAVDLLDSILDAKRCSEEDRQYYYTEILRQRTVTS